MVSGNEIHLHGIPERQPKAAAALYLTQPALSHRGSGRWRRRSECRFWTGTASRPNDGGGRGNLHPQGPAIPGPGGRDEAAV